MTPYIGIGSAGGQHEQREDAKNRFHASLLGFAASRHEADKAASSWEAMPAT